MISMEFVQTSETIEIDKSGFACITSFLIGLERFDPFGAALFGLARIQLLHHAIRRSRRGLPEG